MHIRTVHLTQSDLMQYIGTDEPAGFNKLKLKKKTS